jgi:D-glycero-alpha-D-manno-heptose-7-phosphate kinase
MIISRTPVRLSIGGGGTDLPFFQPRFGASLITSAISKYIYINVNKRFDNTIRLSYSKTEIVDDIDKLQHDRVREALRLLNIKNGIEITTIADIPAGTGMGTSSSFLVGLLNVLHAYKREYIDTKTLAEEASKIEIDILKEPIGKQDQYAAAYGGMIHLNINKEGKVMVSPLNISDNVLQELQENSFMFYTGITRDATEVLTKQKNEVENDERKIENMVEIKKIGEAIKKSLETGNCRRFGEWLNIHWQTKKKMSNVMSNSKIDGYYDLALKNGAVGGKLMGAGGGGFFIFYCDNNKSDFVSQMEKKGLKRIPFRFDFDGSKIVFNA